MHLCTHRRAPAPVRDLICPHSDDGEPLHLLSRHGVESHEGGESGGYVGPEAGLYDVELVL